MFGNTSLFYRMKERNLFCSHKKQIVHIYTEKGMFLESLRKSTKYVKKKKKNSCQYEIVHLVILLNNERERFGYKLVKGW